MSGDESRRYWIDHEGRTGWAPVERRKRNEVRELKVGLFGYTVFVCLLDGFFPVLTVPLVVLSFVVGWAVSGRIMKLRRAERPPVLEPVLPPKPRPGMHLDRSVQAYADCPHGHWDHHTLEAGQDGCPVRTCRVCGMYWTERG